MKTIKSIKNRFIKNSIPGVGRITFGINFIAKKHIKEIEMALYIKTTFGGNIKILQEYYIKDNESQPDYLWNNEYWELKNCSTLRSIDTRLHKGIKQVRDKNNPGGVILNINNSLNTYKEIINCIYKRLSMSKDDGLKIIIILNNKIIDILLINEKRHQGPYCS